MGFRERLGFGRREKALTASPQVIEAARDRQLNLNIPLGVSSQVRDAWLQFQSAQYGWMYGHQPAVRKVVDYIASNIAQLGLKVYRRKSSTERVEEGDHPAAELLREPNPWTPGKQFIFDVFGDFLVYNNAYVLKVQPVPGGRRYLLPIPASATAVLGTGIQQVAGYTIFRTDGSSFTVSPNEMIHWRGYNASDRAMGISKLETLRQELSEAAATQRANVDLMESGLQQRGYIKRPLEASDWNQEGGRDRFLQQFRSAMNRADRGYPILEEGMEIAPLGVSPKDAEMLNSRKLFNDEVASQYGMAHCPPEDEEERKQFYADVIPPLVNLFCDVVRLQLLQVEYMEDDMYVEFDLDEKQMSDDRLKAITSAVGAPPLTRNEGRAMLNLPAKKDGDELITPANVIVGGKPSVGVMPIQDPNKPSQDGDHRDELPPPPGQAQKAHAQLVEDEPPDDWDVHPGDIVEIMDSTAGELVHRDRIDAISYPYIGTTNDLPNGTVLQVVDSSEHGRYVLVTTNGEVHRYRPEHLRIRVLRGAKALEPTTVPRRLADMDRQRRNITKATKVLTNFYNRQLKVLNSQKASLKFDSARWDKELAEDLYDVIGDIVQNEGDIYVARLGADSFDIGLVENYLKTAAKNIARKINAVTQEDFEGEATAREALGRAVDQRAEVAGTGIGARATVIARQEAAKQSPSPETRQQVWIANTDRHAELDGKSVPLGQTWGGIEPGTQANCACSMTIA